LSVSEDRTVQPSPTTAAPASGIADPAPLGLALRPYHFPAVGQECQLDGFCHRRRVPRLRLRLRRARPVAGRNVGVPQQERVRCHRVLDLRRLLDRRRHLVPARGGPALTAAKTPLELATAVRAINHDQAWILLAFAIFNTYMLILSTQVNMAVFAVFLTLEITEIILFIGNFAAGAAVKPTGLIIFGGYVGIVTALTAWYTSAALVSRGMAGGKVLLPVGKPLIS
jgi:succinate-acetate transporter protein